jgi:Meiotically up-regulated gene 113
MEKCAQTFAVTARCPLPSNCACTRSLRRRSPATPTIGNHFRGMANMIEELRGWPAEREDYNDVVILLPDTPTERDGKLARVREQPEGHVYLIQYGKYYRVGRSDELERRVKEIRIALPDAATLVHAIRTDDPTGIEVYWHRRFAHRRAHG